MGISILLFIASAVAIWFLAKKHNTAGLYYIMLVPVVATILIVIFTFAESVGEGFFEIERHLVVENLYEGKYLFKCDIDGGYSVLRKSDSSLTYTKITNIDKDGVYDKTNKLYFIVYKTKPKKTDFVRIGLKFMYLNKYSFKRIQ